MNQRRLFADLLFERMKQDKNIILVTGDLGYRMLDNIKEKFPDRFFNVGAAEQFMLDFSVGLSLSGKIPVVYSITPFLLYRGFETLRTYVNHESIPMLLVGGGRDKDYEHDGWSHDASDDKLLFFKGPLNNIRPYWPKNNEVIRDIVETILPNITKPIYLNLKR